MSQAVLPFFIALWHQLQPVHRLAIELSAQAAVPVQAMVHECSRGYLAGSCNNVVNKNGKLQISASAASYCPVMAEILLLTVSAILLLQLHSSAHHLRFCVRSPVLSASVQVDQNLLRVTDWFGCGRIALP